MSRKTAGFRIRAIALRGMSCRIQRRQGGLQPWQAGVRQSSRCGYKSPGGPISSLRGFRMRRDGRNLRHQVNGNQSCAQLHVSGVLRVSPPAPRLKTSGNAGQAGGPPHGHPRQTIAQARGIIGKWRRGMGLAQTREAAGNRHEVVE